MIAYRMTVAYDGTDYAGWQEQPKLPTVAGELQKTFFATFGHAIKVVGASRTDAGVHALGQECRFLTTFKLDPDRMMRAWNGALPKDIRIRKLCVAQPGFHPHRHIAQKTYFYYISLRQPLPLVQRYCVFVEKLNVKTLRSALALMVGTHDFRPLATDIDAQAHTIKTIDAVAVTYIPLQHMVRIAIRGKSFLRSMVRRMVGAAIYAAQNKCSLDDIDRILKQTIIDNHLPTAPARGLILARVLYTK